MFAALFSSRFSSPSRTAGSARNGIDSRRPSWDAPKAVTSKERSNSPHHSDHPRSRFRRNTPLGSRRPARKPAAPAFSSSIATRKMKKLPGKPFGIAPRKPPGISRSVRPLGFGDPRSPRKFATIPRDSPPTGSIGCALWGFPPARGWLRIPISPFSRTLGRSSAHFQGPGERIRERLAPLPVTALQPSPDWLEVSGSGHPNDRRSDRPPRHELVERLGPPPVDAGIRETDAPNASLRLVRAQIYRESLDLDDPVDSTEPLLLLLRRFVERAIPARRGSFGGRVLGTPPWA